MFVTFKMVFTYVVLGTLAGVFGIPYAVVTGDVDGLYRHVMWILRTGIRVGGIRVEASGQQNVPADVSCIFLANHVSNLDPPALLPALPGRSSVLLKKSLMRIPFLGTAMRMARFVPVERGHSREAAKSSVASAIAALNSGLHILVFAEGTRSKNGRLAPFKRGTFYMAMDTGAPIVPVVISGTERMMRKHSAAITPGVARIQFLPPVDPAKYTTRDELMQAVRASMIAALPEEMRPL
jgi:1-acyl-sn-glycerol-3-phosphate acyltransferase